MEFKKSRKEADHKVVLSQVTWAEVLVRVWTVAILVVAAALVLVTQEQVAANVARVACSQLDCFAIYVIKPCITARLDHFYHKQNSII